MVGPRFVLSLALLGMMAPASQAAMVLGVATSDFGESDSVGITDTDGFIKFFIPVSGSAGYNAVYGVDGAGTSADYGHGFGYSGANGLLMNLRFDLNELDDPIGNAMIAFNFIDLDLKWANDPNGFYESIKFSYFNSDGELVDLTNVIQYVSQFSDSETVLVDGIAAQIIPENPDKDDPIEIDLSGQGIQDIINEIRGAGQSDLYLQVGFGSYFGHNYGTNTPEYLLTASISEPPPAGSTVVPEPASWVILGGLALSLGLVLRRRRDRA